MSKPREKFLIDTDVDVELIDLLKKVGFRARNALTINVPNDDTELLKWAREHGYILVCHDKHRDAKAKYSFYAELYYRGGQIIRISGQPGQDILMALGKILVHRSKWQEFFGKDSGECVVHSSGCNTNTAETLFQRSTYAMRLPFEDPAIPLKTRAPRKTKRTKKPKPPPAGRELV